MLQGLGTIGAREREGLDVAAVGQERNVASLSAVAAVVKLLCSCYTTPPNLYYSLDNFLTLTFLFSYVEYFIGVYLNLFSVLSFFL